MTDIRQAYRMAAKLVRQIPGRPIRSPGSEEELDIIEMMSYPPRYQSSTSPSEDVPTGREPKEGLERGSSVVIQEPWADGKSFAVIDWKQRFAITPPEDALVAFVDGIQRTVLGKEVLVKNGALGMVHWGTIAVGAVWRDKGKRRLVVLEDLIFQKIFILGPFRGLVETGVEGDISPLVEIAKEAKPIPSPEEVLDPDSPLLFIDTTDPEESEIARYRRIQPEVSASLTDQQIRERLTFLGEGFFDFAAQRRRARNRMGRMRQHLEVGSLQRPILLAQTGEWVVLDGTTVDLRWRATNDPRATPRAAFDKVVAVSKTLRTRFLSTSQIAKVLKMEEGQRCSAFAFTEHHDEGTPTVNMKPRISWYLRLRSRGPSGPLSDYIGLVRLEVHKDLVDERWAKVKDVSELADTLSFLIFRDRNPIPSEDPRWPGLLYPVLMAEKVLRSRLPSVESIQAMFAGGGTLG